MLNLNSYIYIDCVIINILKLSSQSLGFLHKSGCFIFPQSWTEVIFWASVIETTIVS